MKNVQLFVVQLFREKKEPFFRLRVEKCLFFCSFEISFFFSCKYESFVFVFYLFGRVFSLFLFFFLVFSCFVTFIFVIVLFLPDFDLFTPFLTLCFPLFFRVLSCFCLFSLFSLIFNITSLCLVVMFDSKTTKGPFVIVKISEVWLTELYFFAKNKKLLKILIVKNVPLFVVQIFREKTAFFSFAGRKVYSLILLKSVLFLFCSFLFFFVFVVCV